ncbi:hypothetical protein LVD15_02915 [Fulvivirga maritima]|uniref:hypothetical protein n=1 Tax=Fulvivirga maritima TaxID=2904247 RepID=UPI001F2C0E21|nr:hypothetical protein [Fulvivirga maritima]UII27399.1 hypothetical protein LVD15_02915 [Fulvivirga maritima]
MGVTKKFLFLLYFFLLSQALIAQEKQASFHFKNSSWPEALQSIADKYDVFLSYDPQLFKEESQLNLEIKNKTLKETLETLLHPKYNFKAIEDYIVITKAPEPVIIPKPAPKPQIVYDTITIEQTIVKYDTQRVEMIVYDTITIKETKHIYDTIQVEKKVDLTNQHWQNSIYLAPNVWVNQTEESNITFKGMGLGFMFSYQLKKLKLQGGVEYNYLLHNVQYTTSETNTTMQIDTVSTYYIIRDGAEIPVYVTDTTEISTEQIKDVDRHDNVQRLTVFAGVGYTLKKGKLSIDLSPGISVSRVFRDDLDDESIIEGDNEINIPPQDYQVDLYFNLPIYFSSWERGEFYIAPYGKIGLSDMASYPKRYMAGIKFGFIF